MTITVPRHSEAGPNSAQWAELLGEVLDNAIDRLEASPTMIDGQLAWKVHRKSADRRLLDPLMAEVARIDIDDPDVDMDPGQRVLYRGELFTGEAEERLEGVVVSLDSYVAGVQDGPSREWYKDGTLRSEGTARMGLPVGVSKEWHPNGTLATERLFAEDGLTLLADRQWDEKGRPTKNWRKGEG
ncbi:toxin-antitoxin system YwqK family antitoxin [Streptomyces sp. NPDC057909]|uniref:toxin-antitoxin system YwqK family antitoxin n=1 Tax=Streptomyces sp. NPDC057909 TaxID=3346277 RepID=UPI0036E25138